MSRFASGPRTTTSCLNKPIAVHEDVESYLLEKDMDGMQKQEMRIKRAHMTLMKNRATALYAGVMLMGETTVKDEDFTAYTDGVNKHYSKKFIEKNILKESQLRGLILHENLHIALKHPIHGRDMYKENAKLANVAADFVVNDIIFNIKDKLSNSNEWLVELPPGALYDEMFHDWSMRKVFDYLKQQNGNDSDSDGNDGEGEGDGGGGDGKPSKVMVDGQQHDTSMTDEHDFKKFKDMSHDEAKEMSDKINKVLREGGMLAGRMGAKVPRVIEELLTPKVAWTEYLRDFWESFIKGKDEFTWRKLNKRQLANDYIVPGVENETIGEVVIAIDTSGSIGGREITEFATEVASLCSACAPEKVRVLWWDTMVHGEQTFADDYSGIASMLKPVGGGGTRVQCVNDYIIKERIKAECVIVFTDGYVENPTWTVTAPTLWLITRNKSWTPPTGKKVLFAD